MCSLKGLSTAGYSRPTYIIILVDYLYEHMKVYLARSIKISISKNVSVKNLARRQTVLTTRSEKRAGF